MERDFSNILISNKTTQGYSKENGLKKTLTSAQLWGISVGAVISGQFIGWNNSLNYVNPFGLIALTGLISVFFVLLVSVMTKLSAMLPYAGGPYAYTRKAFGKPWGFLAGYVTMVEYICITAVIFLYMEHYIENTIVALWPGAVSIIVFFGLVGLQMLGASKASFIELLITCLCISIFLLFFMGINSVDWDGGDRGIDFVNSIEGYFMSIPYVLWFFVGIDVVILTAEEIKKPEQSLPISFFAAILTIIILSFGVIVFSVNSVYWPSLRGTDYPLIFILEKLQRGDAVLLAVFSFFSISSFVASINGLMTGYSRQVFSLARAGYFPDFLNKILDKTKTPYMALIAPSIVVIVIAQLANVTVLIQIVCICAIISYSFSMMAFIRIKTRGGEGFKSIIGACLSLLGCAALMVGFARFQTISTLITLGVIAFGVLYYFAFAKVGTNREAPEEMEANVGEINIIMENL
jgi:ethanolamine permease